MLPHQPENLLYEDQSDTATIKIADFGLAKLLGDTDSMMMTACGTPGYVGESLLCLYRCPGIWFTRGVVSFQSHRLVPNGSP